jgi:hypothetical protein
MSRELGDFLDTTPENLPSGVWIGLLQQAFRLLDGIHNKGIKAPFWTFGLCQRPLQRHPPRAGGRSVG